MMSHILLMLSGVLLHFLWQAIAITGVAVLILRLGRVQAPHGRYAVWLTALSAMLAAPVVTGAVLMRSEFGHASRQDAGRGVAVLNNDDEFDREQTLTAWLLVDQLLAKSVAPETDTAGDSLTNEPEPFPLSPGSASAESPVINLAGLLSSLGRSVQELSREWSEAIVSLWLAGVLAVSLRLLGAVWELRMLSQRLVPVPDSILELAGRLSTQVGLRQTPRIMISPDVTAPLVMQWLRPLILLPASWAIHAPPSVLEAALAHELAHIRRYDLWVNLAQRLAETVWFFHPCVWWVSQQIRMERELCCDAEAVRATGQPVLYAQALEIVARQKWGCSPMSKGISQPGLAVGMGGTRMALLHRVKRVLGVEHSIRESNWWTIGLAGVGISSVCWIGAALWSVPALGDDPADATATEASDRDGEPRKPRPAERDGERPPREGRDGERPRPPREGMRGDRGPGREGPGREGPGHAEPGHNGPGERPPHRPPHEIAEELARLARESVERGQPVPREQLERLVDELHRAHPRSALDGRRPGGPPADHGPHRGPPDMREDGPAPPMMMPEMMRMMHDLRREVDHLRHEVRELREGRHGRGEEPGGRPGPRPEFRDGPPRGDRGPGEHPPGRGPGDRGPEGRGPRDGDGPPRGDRDPNREPAPRDGERPQD